MKAYREDNHARLSVLETIASQNQQMLVRLEHNLNDNFTKINDKIDINMQKIEEKLENNENKTKNEIKEIRKENTEQFKTTIYAIIALIGAPIVTDCIKFLTDLVIKR